VGRLDARRKFYCRCCRYQFSATAGTIFHNSHLPLWKWFLTISAMLASDAGIPSNQLLQRLGGSYKTAWFAQHRVRTALEETALSGGFRPRDAAERSRGAARLFDRPTVGPYHQMGVRYVPKYLAEREWRARSRSNPMAFRETIVRLLACDPLGYGELIARKPRARAGAAGPRLH
jgi:hypothetical protein